MYIEETEEIVVSLSAKDVAVLVSTGTLKDGKMQIRMNARERPRIFSALEHEFKQSKKESENSGFEEVSVEPADSDRKL
jgi:hypothetical protein